MSTGVRLALVALVACSSHPAAMHADAPEAAADAASSIDAASSHDAAPADTATVTALVGGSGAAGWIVYFQSADSTLNATATTDAMGTATGIVVGSGGYVTLVDTTTTPPDELVTWTSVKAGDHFVFARPQTSIALEFTIPTFAGATAYDVATSCGISESGAGDVAMTQVTIGANLVDCVGPQDVAVIAIGSDMQPAASFYVTDQTLANGSTLDYHLQSFTPAAPRTYTWTGDTDTGELLMTDELVSPRGVLFGADALAATGSPPTIAHDALVASPLEDVVETMLDVVDTRHIMYEWGQSASYVGDWGGHRLPDVTAETYSAATKQVAWTTSGGAVEPNLVVAVLEARRGASNDWQWTVVSPSTPVQLPTLPTTIYDFNIAASDDSAIDDTELMNVPDPDAARQIIVGPLHDAAAESGSAGVMSVASYPPLGQSLVRPHPRSRLRLPFSRR
jgi:hypothetical protein